MTDPQPPEPTTPAQESASGIPPSPALSQAARRERAVADALRTLIRDLHQERFGAAPERLGAIDLMVHVRVRPGENWALVFEPSLAEQAGRQIEEAQAAHSVYQPGRVWCFRCESADCEHASPPSAVSVFKAYSSTGLPEWHDLHQAFIAAQDTRVDRLFADTPDTIALVQLGHELRQEQLSSFGRSSKTYAILGQVVAGYFQLPRRRVGRDELRRLAMTFLVIETRGRTGGVELRLNTLAAVPMGMDLDDLFAEEWESWAFRARELASRALAAMSERAEAAHRTRRTEDLQTVMRRVPTVLRRLAEFLERGHRQGQRRTHHVEDRRQRDRRPVHKAMDDAREAPAEAVYADEKTGTFVICGAQGRAHVFNPEGRHVTTFVLGPGDFDLRLRTRRWRRATPEETAGLRQKIQAGTSKPGD